MFGGGVVGLCIEEYKRFLSKQVSLAYQKILLPFILRAGYISNFECILDKSFIVRMQFLEFVQTIYGITIFGNTVFCVTIYGIVQFIQTIYCSFVELCVGNYGNIL